MDFILLAANEDDRITHFLTVGGCYHISLFLLLTALFKVVVPLTELSKALQHSI